MIQDISLDATHYERTLLLNTVFHSSKRYHLIHTVRFDVDNISGNLGAEIHIYPKANIDDYHIVARQIVTIS